MKKTDDLALKLNLFDMHLNKVFESVELLDNAEKDLCLDFDLLQGCFDKIRNVENSAVSSYKTTKEICSEYLFQIELVKKCLEEKKFHNYERTSDLFIVIAEKYISILKRAQVEINMRLENISNFKKQISYAFEQTKGFGVDYGEMSEEQHFALGTFVNVLSLAREYLSEPIGCLKSDYVLEDLKNFMAKKDYPSEFKDGNVQKMIISLCDVIHELPVDSHDIAILGKELSKKKYLNIFGVNKGDFDKSFTDFAKDLLEYKYKKVNYMF